MSELYGKIGWVEDLWLNYEPSKIPPGLTARSIKAVGSFMAFRFADQYGRNIYASAARIGRGVDMHESKVKLARKQLERDGRLTPTGRTRTRVPEVTLSYPDGRSMTTRTLQGTGDRTSEGTQPQGLKTTHEDLTRTPEGTNESGPNSTVKATTSKTTRTSEGTSHVAEHNAHAKGYSPETIGAVECYRANLGCEHCRANVVRISEIDNPWDEGVQAARAALLQAA